MEAINRRTREKERPHRRRKTRTRLVTPPPPPPFSSLEIEIEEKKEAGSPTPSWQLNPLLLLFRATIVGVPVRIKREITSSICQHFALSPTDLG